LSASISCSDRANRALRALRRGEQFSKDAIRALGEKCSEEFFRIVIESLSDSFDASQVEIYEHLMRVWIPQARPGVAVPVVPRRVETVYVLSRVTLGSDIKITSAILDAMKRRFADARIVLVGGRKSAELFAADLRLEHLEADYPRSGPVSARIGFAHELRDRLATGHRIVVDPDSRMTQLGLIPVCEPENYFHFPSRTAGGESSANLTELTNGWLKKTFGTSGEAYVAPETVSIDHQGPVASVSLGVGGNEIKRVGNVFEAGLIRMLADRYRTVWVDRGAGAEEAQRVTAAASGVADRVRFWEGSFAGFASIIAQSHFFAGYDSAGQHAAAAAGIPLIAIFAGAGSKRFRDRWAPYGPGPAFVMDADEVPPDLLLGELVRRLPLHTRSD
jgi:ADP-heptose:LPS heptosyltransferase